MGRTACTELQCLYKGDLYFYLLPIIPNMYYRSGWLATWCVPAFRDLISLESCCSDISWRTYRQRRSVNTNGDVNKYPVSLCAAPAEKNQQKFAEGVLFVKRWKVAHYPYPLIPTHASTEFCYAFFGCWHNLCDAVCVCLWEVCFQFIRPCVCVCVCVCVFFWGGGGGAATWRRPWLPHSWGF
jgi:hypothetical protein